jgi:hypothetical protein
MLDLDELVRGREQLRARPCYGGFGFDVAFRATFVALDHRDATAIFSYLIL